MDPSAVIASLLCLVPALLTLGYAALCAASPFGRCRRCSGTGKRRTPLTRITRDCHRCDGIGRRIRLGQHLVNEIRREYRNGTR
ncbi:hypothetical protein OIE47_12595 [Micromonospora sp. NBC_01796]|nr:hypothetical protein OIE47_12595 [Micromonospora sp. NBC_01796]